MHRGRSAEVVAALAAGREPPPYSVRWFTPIPVVPAGERPITVDQTNESVVVGERLVVKWMREPSPGHHRAPDLLAHLSQVGFARMPTPYAALIRGNALCALVCAYLPGATDGYDWALAALLDGLTGGAGADFPAALGTLVGELHAALATPSPVFRDPVAHVSHVDFVTPALSTLDRALDLITDDDGDWLRARADRMRTEIGAARAVTRTPILRLHGDLHIGQVMRWRDGYAVTDFDGNPTVPDAPVREPVARDVAQLRTSLAHIGQMAHRRTDGVYAAQVTEWTTRSGTVFLDAYRAALMSRDLLWLFDERLLRPYEVEQECRELIYSARFLPRWRYAPMGVLHSWFDDAP